MMGVTTVRAVTNEVALANASAQSVWLTKHQILFYVVLVLIIIGLCLLANFIARKVLLKLVSRLIKKNKYSWDDKMYERKVFHRLAHFLNPLVISLFAGSFPAFEEWIRR
jgi:miniconductance mechanosensitive channel